MSFATAMTQKYSFRNALQPAEVEQVLLCDMIGRAIVLVQEDQLSLAIGRRGQNVRLGSKLCGWDIEIMTGSELEDQIERAVTGFSQIAGVTEEIAQSLVEQGYLSYDDLSVIEPDQFMEMSGLSAADVDRIVEVAETMAEEAEQAAAEERRVRREREQTQKEAVAAGGAAPKEASQDAAPKDAAPKDAAPKDAAPKDAAPKEVSQGAAPEEVSQDAAPAGEGETAAVEKSAAESSAEAVEAEEVSDAEPEAVVTEESVVPDEQVGEETTDEAAESGTEKD